MRTSARITYNLPDDNIVNGIIRSGGYYIMNGGKNGYLSGSFASDIQTMDSLLRISENFDILKRELEIAGKSVVMYYIDGFVTAGLMQKLLLYLVTVKDMGDGSCEAASDFAKKSLPSVEVNVTNSIDDLLLAVMSGCSAFFCEGFGENAIIIDVRTYPARSAEEPENDRVMRGSRDGFVETLLFNTAMLRRRIRDPGLTVKYINAGRRTKTDLALCYIVDRADPDYVKSLSNKLSNLDTDSLVLGHQSIAESLIRDRWWNPFPKIRTTERPDAAAATILEGGIILLCDNSPEAMIFPTSIFDFLQETDDYYFPPLTGTYLRLLRHFIFILTVYLTPTWYLLLRHAASLPEWLQFIVPTEIGALPVLAQLLLTEFALDGLKLASLNTPSVLSNSLSVVGGLLLGDFAVSVGWLSPDVILYMAFVGIANFTQSSYELGYAFKYIRIVTLILTFLFDVYGFAAASILTIILIASNKTANGSRSYLYPLIPFNAHALAALIFRLKKSE